MDHKHKSGRRNFLRNAASGLGAVALGGLGNPRNVSAQSRELVVGHYGGAGPKLIRKVLFPALQKRYPDAKFLIREGGAADRRALLQANPQNPEIDIYYQSLFDAKQMMEIGLTDAPDPKAVPVYRDLYSFSADGAYGCYINMITVVTNPKHAKVDSWFDLWRPEFKNRISLPNTKTAVNQTFVTGIIRAMGGNEKNRKHVEDARKKLLELRPNAVVYHTGTSQALTVMQSGDASVGVMLAGYAYEAADNGQSVQVNYPKEGVSSFLDAMTIAKNSKNKELAHAYVNLALSQPVQSAFAEELYWGPTNRNVQLSEKATTRVAFGKERVDKLINPEWDYLLKVRADWNEWWDRNMGR